MTNELMCLTLAEVSELIKQKSVSPVEVTTQALEQIEQHADDLKAFISHDPELALAAAREAEQEIARGRYRGALHGIPIALKDNIYLRNQVTTMGSKIHRNFVPSYDATVAVKLRDAGAVILGKTNMHEYALGVTTDNPHFGTCRNPWDLDRTPGGSSGGSAAAVAGSMALGALGTDTSGSIRIPAAACGLVGLKPTYGRVSKYGCFPEAWTLDHVGALTGTVTDAAIMLDAISGYDVHDHTSVGTAPPEFRNALSTDIRDCVIGVEEEFYFHNIDDGIALIVRAGIDRLRELGATILPVKLPTLQHCVWALTIIDSSETTSVHEATLASRASDYGEDVRFLLECGTLPTAVDYVHAQQLRRRIQLDFAEAFKGVDAIISPTLPIRTPLIGETSSDINGTPFDTVESVMRLVGPANLVGLPSMSVPCGLLDGLPIGLELIGRPFGEQTILDLGLAFESTDPLDGAHPEAYLNR